MNVDVNSISYIGVFLEGIMAFLSPCVLPLIPLYMSYLSSGAKSVDEKGEVSYKSVVVFFTTLAFVFGICTTYFIMGLALNYVKTFISDYQNIISIIGGMLLIFFALNQFGIISIKGLDREYRIENNIKTNKMNYFKAYVLGFIFSFAWTPCIGPILANVLILAASKEVIVGNIMIALYSLGFSIPFILMGLFYTKALNFLKKHRDGLIKFSKIVAVIILLFGCNMIYDGSKNIIKINKEYNKLIANGQSTNSDKQDENKQYTKMIDFSLKDQYGNIHNLSDYEGKYVIFNFISSWCTYCKQEIPEFESFAKDEKDFVVLYVMSDDMNKANGGISTDEFISQYNVELPVLYDDDEKLMSFLRISSYPTMYIIGPDSTVIGYQSGKMTKQQISEIKDIAIEMYEGR